MEKRSMLKVEQFYFLSSCCGVCTAGTCRYDQSFKTTAVSEFDQDTCFPKFNTTTAAPSTPW